MRARRPLSLDTEASRSHHTLTEPGRSGADQYSQLSRSGGPCASCPGGLAAPYTSRRYSSQAAAESAGGDGGGKRTAAAAGGRGESRGSVELPLPRGAMPGGGDGTGGGGGDGTGGGGGSGEGSGGRGGGGGGGDGSA